jgi:carbon monoxide dehydrogenase subunit G
MLTVAAGHRQDREFSMLRIEGDTRFPQPPAQVWGKLSDARFLAECIPGVETLTLAEPDHVQCVLRPGFTFVRGTLELTLEVVDRLVDRSAGLLLHTKGIGTTSEVEARWTLEPEGEGSRLHWVVEVKSLGGLLKAVPQGLIKAGAQKVVSDALAAVAAKLR